MCLIIRSSSIHAAGCYTTSRIRRDARVVEYTGPQIPKQEADDRYEKMTLTYLFGIGDGNTVIDGHGTAMFINHSCDPNCETRERNGRVWIIALRDILPGEEITYDYNLYDGDDDEARCNCGAKNCRKTMYSPEEIRRRRRAARASETRAQTRRSQKREMTPPLSRRGGRGRSRNPAGA